MRDWLEDLLQQAAMLAREHRRTGFEIEIKPDDSPVTSADYAVHHFLAERIRAQFPADCILSEEGCDPECIRQSARRAWIIDPIDGTKLFIDGHPDYAILIGLWEDGTMTASAASWPEQDLFVLAERGAGCTVNGAAAAVSQRTLAEARIRGYGTPFRRYTNVDTPDVSGARALVRILEGDLDGVLMRISGTWGEHDIAFAVCAIEEAGGRITDGAGNPLQLNAPVRQRPAVILASNGTLHDHLLKVAAVSGV